MPEEVLVTRSQLIQDHAFAASAAANEADGHDHLAQIECWAAIARAHADAARALEIALRVS